MSCNARPVTPVATEYKAYLLDTVRSIPLYGSSFKQLASKMNYFKQLMIGNYRPISRGISGPASMSFAEAHKVIILKLTTPSGTLGCHANIFESVQYREFLRLILDGSMVVKLDGIKLVSWVSLFYIPLRLTLMWLTLLLDSSWQVFAGSLHQLLLGLRVSGVNSY